MTSDDKCTKTVPYILLYIHCSVACSIGIDFVLPLLELGVIVCYVSYNWWFNNRFQDNQYKWW